MDQLNAVLDGNLDNLVASEIGSDRGILTALGDDVGFVGLCFSLSIKLHMAIGGA